MRGRRRLMRLVLDRLDRRARLVRARAVVVRRRRFSDYLAVADLLLQQGKYRFRVYSDSMVPALRPGAILRLDPVRPEQLAFGDLVATRLGDTLVCHRLMRWYGDPNGVRWVVTKGDRSSDEDFPVRAEMVIGRVASVMHPPLWRLLLWRAKRRGARLLRSWLSSVHSGVHAG